MSLGLRYKGGFYSIGQILYDIMVYQEGYVGDVSPIAFCDTPITIEWAETNKLDPVQSSKAVLRLYSDMDRQFIDLYTIKSGSVRMDVFRNGGLYWSGILDPELYEEPFSYRENYGVELTFSDFSLLDRMNFSGKGFLTLAMIVDQAMNLSGINYSNIDEHISTRISSYAVETLSSDVSFIADNFYDEDGMPMTWREVLEECLRPFCLRLIQKGGKIIVYDLNNIYTSIKPVTVKWVGNDATLGVDKIYNNVLIKYSPYHHNTLLDAGVDYTTVTGGEEYGVRVNQDMASRLGGFKVRISDSGKGLEIGKTLETGGGFVNPRYFAITPIFSGNEEAGVAYTIKIDHTGQSGENYTSYLSEASPLMPLRNTLLLKAPQNPYLANVSGTSYKLRISMEMMADVRYNPYETDNEGGDQQRMRDWCNFSYVPFRLILRDASGSAISHYENKEVYALKGVGAYNYNLAKWVSGEGTWGDAFLAYYNLDEEGRKNDTGLLGWKTNKQCIGYYRKALPKVFHKRGDGEFVNLPPGGGWLDLQIGKGLLTYDYESDTEWQTKIDIYWRIRWLLFKSLKISLVDSNYQDIKAEDVEINAWLNKDAKEGLKIETVVGCLENPSPTALGQIYLTGDKSVLNKFWRGGITTSLEKLMIGTVYTNYASRHAVLTGTVELLPLFGTYIDMNERGMFLLLSEVQDLRADESEIKMVVFETDDYEGIEYK